MFKVGVWNLKGFINFVNTGRRQKLGENQVDKLLSLTGSGEPTFSLFT